MRSPMTDGINQRFESSGVAVLAAISAKLTADRGRWAVHDASNIALLMSGFEKDRNLVSFVLGVQKRIQKMCVGHSRQL